MSWHTDQLRYALGLGGLVTFYGLVTLIIFVAGSRFGVDLSYQIVIVALVLLTLPFALVISLVASRRKRKRELAAQKEEESKKSVEENGAPPVQKISSPSGRYEELNTSANTTFQFLQTSNLAGDAKGKDAIYALPFFLFAGTPRSGKSSLVLSSNFNFQTLPNQRQSEQNFLRPTRHADWRVSSEAVLVDTAGRYQTETEADSDEWTALLEILKKQRGLRPFDGLVLVANAEKLINADETEIEQQAKLLRARLDDAMQRAKVRFPVYLVFSNADAIEGFRDSFSVSQREGKNLMLGATFPLEKAMNGAHALFDAEFEALQNGLLRRRLLRLSAPFPPIRQLRIFNFPAHFTASRKKLGHFVATLFRPNPFSESPLFRGFYFTANLPNNNGIGASYFSERFFRDVLLRDKDLVAAFQSQKQRPPVLGWLLLGFGALLTVILLAMSGVSVYFNRQLVNDATLRGLRVREMNRKDAGKNPLAKDANEKEVDLNTLEDLRKSLKTLDDYNRSSAPLYMRFGMYSGDRLFLGDRTNKGLFGIYADAVEQRFKKPMVAALVADLQKFSQSPVVSSSANETQEAELERNYKLLKTYLMLTAQYKNKAEATFLNEQLKPYWKEFSKNAPRLEVSSEQQLAFFAAQVDRPEFEAIAPDEQLVNAARARLRALPAWVKQYNNIISDANKKVDPIGLENVLVGNRYASFLQSDGYKVPGSFTLNGYRQEISNAIANARTVLIQPDWVMGETAANDAATDADVEKLKNRYFTEYTEQWRKLIQSVEVAPYNNSKEQAEAALQAFASADSPINLILKETARNTNLAAKPNDWWNWIVGMFASKGAEKTDVSSMVVKQYSPLFTFVGADKPGETQQTALGNYQSSLGNLGRDLARKSQDEVSKDLVEKDGKGIGLKGKETEIEGYLSTLNTAETKEVADLLKQPLDNLKAVFGADVKSQIEKTWKDQLFPRAAEIEKGFPFTDAGEADLPKLTAYLNKADGALTKFYETKLQKYFDDAGGQLKPKEQSEVKFSAEFVNYLNNAFRLREALYGKGATPNFEYDVTLQPVKDAIVELSIDGNKIDSEGTRSGKFTFPARAGQETGVVLQLVSTASPQIPAANSNLNTNSSANVSNSNVNTGANVNTIRNFAQTNDNNSAANAPLRFPGQWGVFRLLENGGAQKKESGEYVLNLKVGNKIAVVTIRPTGGDIFNREIFRSVRTPQSILK